MGWQGSKSLHLDARQARLGMTRGPYPWSLVVVLPLRGGGAVEFLRNLDWTRRDGHLCTPGVCKTVASPVALEYSPSRRDNHTHCESCMPPSTPDKPWNSTPGSLSQLIFYSLLRQLLAFTAAAVIITSPTTTTFLRGGGNTVCKPPGAARLATSCHGAGFTVVTEPRHTQLLRRSRPKTPRPERKKPEIRQRRASCGKEKNRAR